MALAVMAGSVSAQPRTYTSKTIGKHADEVLGVFVNDANTGFATCSIDETIKTWSLPDGKELRTFTGHIGQVNNISFSGDDKYLASASNDRTVRVWNAETGAQEAVLKGHTAEVIGVYFSQDNSTVVASTSFDKTVKLWDWKLGVEIKTLRGHTMQTNNVAYSYDGRFLASCSDDRSIRIWSTDPAKKEPLMTLEGHTAPVLTVLYALGRTDPNDQRTYGSCAGRILRRRQQDHRLGQP
jgi:WD40 repeat protein